MPKWTCEARKLELVSRKIFEKAVKTSREYHVAIKALYDEENETFGFTHSDKDADKIIDVFAYGGDMAFEEYKRIMDGLKAGKKYHEVI